VPFHPRICQRLDDLKNAITPLQGQGVLHGVYEAKQHKPTSTPRQPSPRKAPPHRPWSTRMRPAWQIRWDRALLSAPPRSGRTQGQEDRSAGIADQFELGLARCAGSQLCAKFLEALASSQFTSERADTYQGKPARLIELTSRRPTMATTRSRSRKTSMSHTSG